MRLKRSGSLQEFELDDIPAPVPDESILQLEAALSELSSIAGPLAVTIVEHIFFARYSKKDTAEILGMTDAQLNSLWKHARARLRTLLNDEPQKKNTF